jgi:flagellin
VSIGAISNSYQYGLDQQKYSKELTQLSTGKRVNGAADDPAGYAIATQLQTQADAFNAAAQNISTAQNAVNVAQGALAQDSTLTSQLNTLSIQGANDFLSPTDRAALQAQANQTVAQINTNAQSTTFNGQQLLNGGFAGAVQSGANEGSVTNVGVPNGSAAAIGVAPNLTSTANAQTTELNSVSAAQNLGTTQATIGAQQVALGYDQQAAQISSNALTASASSITDLNVGQGVTSANSSQLRSQIALYAQHMSNIFALQLGQYVDIAA